jgi:universal stress protein E
MSALQNILLATDFCPASQRAADVAIELAWNFGCHVNLLHVMEPMPSWAESAPEQRGWSEKLLSGVRETLVARKVRVGDSAIAIGPAADTILSHALSTDADMILMGAGESPTTGDYRPGPVAEAVIEHALQPVLAVYPGAPSPKFQKIICPVDFSVASQRAVVNAIRLAKAFHGQLIVLSVVPHIGWISLAATIPAETWLTSDAKDAIAKATTRHAEHWRVQFDLWLDQFDFQGVTWTKELRHGKPDDEILAAAQANASDLIVMGTIGASGLMRTFLGGTTRRVLRELPCSLLTVKDEDLVDELDEAEVATVNKLFTEGQTLCKARSYAAAIHEFDKVLIHNPFHIPALDARAEACDAIGQRARATRCRERADALRTL